MIVPELEFRNIERHIFPADLVERADHAPLEYRPEAFNRVRVDRADNVFAVAMADDLVGVVVGLQMPVADPLIRDQQAHLVGDAFQHEARENVAAHGVDHAGDGLALAADSAVVRGAARRWMMSRAVAVAL